MDFETHFFCTETITWRFKESFEQNKVLRGYLYRECTIIDNNPWENPSFFYYWEFTDFFEHKKSLKIRFMLVTGGNNVSYNGIGS